MNCAIILAAGSGTRFTKQKQFCEFHGKKLWELVYDKVTKFILKENVVVVGVDIVGGETRTESVKKGLEYLKLKNSYDKVIILEAARPMVTLNQIEDMLKINNDSITYMRPLVNTIMKKDGTYVDRNDYIDLLTPQCFNFGKLCIAYENKKYINMTDETRVMFDTFGIKPYFIEGDDYLFKVTYPNDLIVLEALYLKGEK